MLKWQARITAPCGVVENVAKKYATLFGALSAFLAEQRSTLFGRNTYVVTYGHAVCTVAANTVTMDPNLDSSLRQV